MKGAGGRRRSAIVLGAAALLAIGCARATTPPVEIFAEPGFGRDPLRTLAVLPARVAAGASKAASGAVTGVTEITVREAARVAHWRVIEPESVPEAKTSGAIALRAGEAAAGARADAALQVLVLRWRERVGSDYGVSEPASVAVRLLLVPSGGDDAVWKADYAFTQEPLAYNLWNLWGVLRGGPKWLTAGEIARIGIAEAVSRLADATR